MAYLPSNAPIGPNSLEPSNEVCDARVREANGQAAIGRLAAFITTPPLSSFDSPTLAGDAARILHQSRVGRSSILSPAAPEPNQHAERVNLREWIADAPEVVSLNGRGDYCGGGPVRSPAPPAQPQMVMPEPAPVAVQVRSHSRGPAPIVFVNPNPPETSWLLPAGGIQMQAGGTRYMGYSGYAPPWGDAGLMDIGLAPIEGGSWLPWLLGGAALVMLGSAVGVKRRKRRYGKR